MPNVDRVVLAVVEYVVNIYAEDPMKSDNSADTVAKDVLCMFNDLRITWLCLASQTGHLFLTLTRFLQP